MNELHFGIRRDGHLTGESIHIEPSRKGKWTATIIDARWTSSCWVYTFTTTATANVDLLAEALDEYRRIRNTRTPDFEPDRVTRHPRPGTQPTLFDQEVEQHVIDQRERKGQS